MIRLVVFLLIAVGGALLATWLADNPGRVSLVWRGTQVETTFPILLVGALLFGIVLTVLFELLNVVVRAPRQFGQQRRRGRAERGHQALSQGLIAAAAGDAAAAKSLNRQAQKLLENDPSTLLLSAQTAQLEGDEAAAKIKFQEMLKHPETEFLGLRGLLAVSIKAGDKTTALRLAKRAHLRRPSTPWVLSTLFDLQTQAELWSDALQTVSEMKRQKLIDRATASRRQAILYHQQAAAARAAERPYEALFLAQKAHKLAPDFAPVAVQASTLAEQTNQPKVARRIIETAWKAQPHPALAKAYLGLDGAAPARDQLQHVQRLYQLEPGHVESELALAERAIAAKSWRTAREALERAIKIGPTASAYRLLAEIAQAEGDGEKARSWLGQAVDAPPDHTWVCDATGEVRAEWSAFGPDGQFDSLRWGQPSRLVPLLRDQMAELILPPSTPSARTTAESAAPTRETVVDPPVREAEMAPKAEAKSPGDARASPAAAAGAAPVAKPEPGRDAKAAPAGGASDKPQGKEASSVPPIREAKVDAA